MLRLLNHVFSCVETVDSNSISDSASTETASLTLAPARPRLVVLSGIEQDPEPPPSAPTPALILPLAA